ncbi:hypothetical protein C7974DRAFT_466356 [Boeremia exigua]|uniref:uncharacterized protein n=1 Tax=Boeremia exigua TaxID=749465 RepID=UPI001E8D6C63|nr:uncharacterized protein C7974DRAFT_466356 [Boeremia exigua]KAH6613824.1 hypothetical protein C7974DRAFT_466356 [Boeremia exigua]
MAARPAGVRQEISGSSLREFSLASKACYAASTLLIYQHIKITAYNHQRLQRDVEELLKVLHREDSTYHVRCITIKGNLRLDAKATNNDSFEPHWKTCGLGEILDDPEYVDWSGRHVVYDKPVIKKLSEEDLAWAPVVSLLQTVRYLKDLIYDCQSQFPPSLLEILEEQHPQCRLHHLTFRFRTLLWGTPYPYEMQLAKSPVLHAVKITCSRRDTDGDDDYNAEAIMEIAGMAPNLKKVTVLQLQPMLANRFIRPRQPWLGLPGYTKKCIGSLTSLSLKGYPHLESPELLQDWTRHTDFSCLQHLTLGSDNSSYPKGLTSETMGWLSQSQPFSQLRTLCVYLDRDDMYIERPDYSANAVSFFHALPPLQEITVRGPIDSLMVDAIVSRHGSTLKKLSIHTFERTYHNWVDARVDREIPVEFTRDRLLQIQAECPALEDLAVPLYRIFATMHNLRFLFLTLDCSNWHVGHDSTYDPHFDADDEKLVDPDKPHLKRVDEVLARSIWKVRLKLYTTGGGDYGGNNPSSFITGPLDVLSRSWLIERPVRTDRQDVTVRELGKHEREARYRYATLFDGEPERLFHDIWPPKEGSRDWRHDWSSYPLQT